MSLINCPNCDKTISDKAKFCPNCNYVFDYKGVLPKTVICEECEREYFDNMPACPNCGCPKPRKRGKNKIAAVFAILVILTVIFVFTNNVLKSSEYYENAKNVTETMLDGASNAEGVGNLIVAVWGNSISKRENKSTDEFTMQDGVFVNDFNDALSNLYSDKTFNKNIDEIRNNRSETLALMKKLKNPPRKYEELYSEVKEVYDKYLKFTRFVIDSKGSYNSFSEGFNTYDTEFTEAYEKVLLCFD